LVIGVSKLAGPTPPPNQLRHGRVPILGWRSAMIADMVNIAIAIFTRHHLISSGASAAR